VGGDRARPGFGRAISPTLGRYLHKAVTCALTSATYLTLSGKVGREQSFLQMWIPRKRLEELLIGYIP